MANLSEALASIRKAATGTQPAAVTILGGGIAGLVAAYELEQLGYDVTLYEARSHAQGRLRTHRFDDGSYGEFGAMRIPLHHDAPRHYATVCGLELRPFITAHQNLNGFYDIAGVVTRMHRAPQDLYPKFELSASQREDAIPPKILGRAVSDVVDGLTDAERASLRTPHLSSDRLRDLDDMTMREFLEERCGPDATELAGLATGLEAMYDRSVMMLLRDALVSSGDGFSEIVGGMDLLPAGIATLLKTTTIHTDTPVVAIRRLDDGATELTVERDGVATTEVAERVVCAIPFSALRRIDIESAFSRSKLRTIRELSYESSTKVLLRTASRFWESNDGIVGGASLSDRIWRACYYPSDNAQVNNEATASERRYNTMYGAYEGGRYVPRDPAVSAGTGVLLGSYTWGQDAVRMGTLPHDERVAVTIRELSAIHPELAEPGMVTGAASIFWDNDRWCGGAFCEPAPGEHSRLFADTIASDGGVHFAGEHTSTDPGWIQGAMMSAVRAVGEIVGVAS